MSGMARAHRAVGWGFFALVVLQFFLAGVGIFGAGTFDAHVLNATLLQVLSLVLVLVAVAGRLGRDVVAMSALLFVVVGVQGALPLLRDDAAFVAALHPVNALVVLGMGYAVARGRTLARRSAGDGERERVADRPQPVRGETRQPVGAE